MHLGGKKTFFMKYEVCEYDHSEWSDASASNTGSAALRCQLTRLPLVN